MQWRRRLASVLLLSFGVCAAKGLAVAPPSALRGDAKEKEPAWTQFRGPGGLGTSAAKDLPIHWSDDKTLVWKTRLPGPGTSSPVIAGNRIFLTCYTGYALDAGNPGRMADLRRHLLCLNRDTGKIVWRKELRPELPEHQYQGEGSYHGYSSSTPTTDGERL